MELRSAGDSTQRRSGGGGSKAAQPLSRPAGAQRFELAALAPQPWKNGAGLTREIAVHPPGADMASFDWRISVAEVERDAPFSAFPGVDRCIVLLAGSGMRLVPHDGAPPLVLEQPFEPLRFAGDVALDGRLLDGPCRDFNVMTRRGAWRSEVLRLDAAGSAGGTDAGLVLCCAGRWQAGDERLEAGQGLCWRHRIDSFPVQPTLAGTLLYVRLCHDRT
jgi:environmental stress-induced protein Ves